MELTSLLAPEFVKCGLLSRTKDAALREILELGARGSEASVSRLAEALAERERLGPLSMAKGTAFPHVRSEALCELRVVLGTAPEGIDFRSPDGNRIRLLVLFLIPSRHSNLYLETLARFLDLLGKEEVFQRVIGAKSPENLIAELLAASSGSGTAPARQSLERPRPLNPAPPGLPFGLLPRGP